MIKAQPPVRKTPGARGVRVTGVAAGPERGCPAARWSSAPRVSRGEAAALAARGRGQAGGVATNMQNGCPAGSAYTRRGS
jgi:hypothetical protein